MKKVMNPAPPLAVATNRNPLTVMLSINIVGRGTLTQTQDSTRNLWQPNRDPAAGGMDPLVLEPELEVFNQDTKAKVAVQASYAWYIGSETETAVDANETGRVDAIGGDGADLYYRESSDGHSTGTPTGRLVVRKNVDYRSSRKIILKAVFTATGRGEYTRYAEVTLSSANRPDDFYTVKLQCPNTVKFNPFKGESSLRTFRAVAERGKDNVSASCKYFWTLDGTAIPTDGSVPCYQAANQPSGKGQGTDTIVLDMDCVDGMKLGVAISESLSAAAPMDHVTDCCALTWDIPELEVVTYTKGGRYVKETDTVKTFGSILKADGVDVPDSVRDEYVLLSWWLRPSDTGVKTRLGFGNEQVIDASLLKKTGGVRVDVGADLLILGPLEVLTDDNGDPLTDDSGSDTASDYSGLVVGRCWDETVYQSLT